MLSIFVPGGGAVGPLFGKFHGRRARSAAISSSRYQVLQLCYITTFLARLVVGSYSSATLAGSPGAALSSSVLYPLFSNASRSKAPVQIARFCLLLTCRPSPSNRAPGR